MMKKGSIAAILFVLIVGIVGAVFLYGGGSSETGAMLLEQEDGSPSPTSKGEQCKAVLKEGQTASCKIVAGTSDASFNPNPGACSGKSPVCDPGKCKTEVEALVYVGPPNNPLNGLTKTQGDCKWTGVCVAC